MIDNVNSFMMDYQCYYCPRSETTLKAILEHSVSKHSTEVLNYKKLILCKPSGKRRFRTINYEHIHRYFVVLYQCISSQILLISLISLIYFCPLEVIFI